MFDKLYKRMLMFTRRISHNYRDSDPKIVLGREPRKRLDYVPWHGYATAFIPAGGLFMYWYTGYYRVQLHNYRIDKAQASLEEPVPLPKSLDEVNQMEYRRVIIKGRFDHSREMFITPRKLKTGLENALEYKSMLLDLLYPKRFNKNLIGSWVVTPFKLADRDAWIVVNRGWVPYDMVNPENRKEAQVEGDVELVGYIRKSEFKQSLFERGNDFESNKWKRLDVPRFAKKLDTLPIFIDVDRATSINGGPVGGQTLLDLHPSQTFLMDSRFLWCLIFIFSFMIWWNVYIRSTALISF